MLITRTQRLMISGICMVFAILLFLWAYPQVPQLGGSVGLFSLQAFVLFAMLAAIFVLFLVGLAGLLVKSSTPEMDQRTF